MARAIWNGSINFGLVTIPVKLYPAVREHSLHFNYLHGEDEGPIRYERVCSVCGKKVAWQDIVRGYDVGGGRHVVVTDEDFEKASPEASHTIDIVEFVDLDQIEPVLFDTPYYLEPERRGRHAYALLREALRRSGKVGIARVVLRTREHLAVLKPEGKALVVETVHWNDEVVPPTELDLPEPAAHVPPGEMKMAATLIDAMTTRFDPAAFEDRYRDKLVSLIEAHAAGRRAPRAKGRPQQPTKLVDLEDVLRKSLKRAKRRHAA